MFTGGPTPHAGVIFCPVVPPIFARARCPSDQRQKQLRHRRSRRPQLSNLDLRLALCLRLGSALKVTRGAQKASRRKRGPELSGVKGAAVSPLKKPQKMMSSERQAAGNKFRRRMGAEGRDCENASFNTLCSGRLVATLSSSRRQISLHFRIYGISEEARCLWELASLLFQG